MDKGIKIYKNLLWDILDESSQLFILSLLIDLGFDGNCKMEAVIKDDICVMVVKDEIGNEKEFPINILDILNG